MSGRSDDRIAQLEHELEGVERTLSGMGRLNDEQAERVAARMDRLTSQLLEVSSPPPIDAVHARLGTVPASSEDFADLVDQMRPRDHEG